MEKIANNIADKIARELNADNDKKEVIAYGMFALVQMVISIMLVIIFGCIFGVTIEALIISFTTSILRKYSGGVHASSPVNCIILGTSICVVQAVLAVAIIKHVNIYIIIIFGGLVCLWSYYIIYKLAPVDNIAKPIKRQKRRNKMKRVSLIILSIYLIILLIDVVLYIYIRQEKILIYFLCICLGIAWQTFTLTQSGHFIIYKVDKLLIFGRRE